MAWIRTLGEVGARSGRPDDPSLLDVVSVVAHQNAASRVELAILFDGRLR